MTITFAAPLAEQPLYAPVIAAFEQQQPGIRVQFVARDAVEPVSSDADTQIRQVVQAADVALVETSAVTLLKAPQQVVLDLKPLLDSNPSFNQADLYPRAIQGANGNGSIYSIARDIPVRMLLYNKDRWTQRGLPEPSSTWTWEDLFTAATQLAERRASPPVYGFGGSGGRVDEAIMAEFTQAGIDITASSTPRVIDQNRATVPFGQVVKLVQSNALYYKPGANDIGRLIREGQIGMWTSDTVLDQSLPFQLGIAVLPPLPTPMVAPSSTYIISKGTQHSQAAWSWLSFVSRTLQPPSLAGLQRLTLAPARVSIAEQSGYLRELDAQTGVVGAAAVMRATLARPASLFMNIDTIGALDRAIAAVVQRQQSLQTALDAALAQQASAPTPAQGNGAPIVVATPVPSVANATSITFGVTDYGYENVAKIAQSFVLTHPEIKVNVQVFNDTDVMSKQSDCFAWNGPLGDDVLSSTLDLQPLIDADASFDRNDYPALFLAPFRYNGEQRGLPDQVRFRVLYYNKSLFDAAGIEYPRADWTRDDVLRTLEKLDQGSGDKRQYGFASVSQQTADIAFTLDWFGVAPFVGQNSDLRPNFADPKVEEALRFYIDLLHRYSPNDRIEGYTSQNRDLSGRIDTLIREGRVGMWFENTPIVSNDPYKPTPERSIAPPPLANRALSTNDFTTSGLFISSTSRNPQACWTRINALSADASRIGIFENFPARLSIAQSDAFLSQAAPGSAAVFAAYKDALERTPQTMNTQPGTPLDYRNGFWLFRAVDRALQGKNLQRELDEAQRLTEDYLACMQASGVWRTCALQVDPSYAS